MLISSQQKIHHQVNNCSYISQYLLLTVKQKYLQLVYTTLLKLKFGVVNIDNLWYKAS